MQELGLKLKDYDVQLKQKKIEGDAQMKIIVAE